MPPLSRRASKPPKAPNADLRELPIPPEYRQLLFENLTQLAILKDQADRIDEDRKSLIADVLPLYREYTISNDTIEIEDYTFKRIHGSTSSLNIDKLITVYGVPAEAIAACTESRPWPSGPTIQVAHKKAKKGTTPDA